MKVFISWSGERSQNIANALREWLPNVIQAIQPWMSISDIDKGARWSSDIASKLEESVIGIICLTPENLKAPWILFETGALSKTVDNTFVCPYLFQVEPADVSGPLVQFQFTKSNKDDTQKLIATINKALGKSALPEQNLSNAFEKWWPEFEKKLKDIPDIQVKKEKRSDREILEEILDLVRKKARETLTSEYGLTSEHNEFLSSSLVGLSPLTDIIKRIIVTLEEEHVNSLASKEEIIRRASNAGIAKIRTEEILQVLKRVGKIFELESGFFRSSF